MRTKLALIALSTASLLSGGAPARAESLSIVATVPDLAAIALEVGGPRTRVRTLSLPTQDPHFVDARPNLALELARADLLLLVGLDLEIGWLPTLVTGSRNPKIQRGARGHVDCSEIVRRLDAPTQKLDRSKGDIHAGGNPHYLYDPRNAVVVARGIAARLGEVDPDGAATYQKNAERFAAEIEAARAGWEAKLAPLKGARVIGYHKSWTYLADWLGLVVIDHIEPRPGIPPNPAHVAEVLAAARRDSARLILQEIFYPDATSRLIADRSGAKLVRVSGGADITRGERYVDRMKKLVDDLAPGAAG